VGENKINKKKKKDKPTKNKKIRGGPQKIRGGAPMGGGGGGGWAEITPREKGGKTKKTCIFLLAVRPHFAVFAFSSGGVGRVVLFVVVLRGVFFCFLGFGFPWPGA